MFLCFYFLNTPVKILPKIMAVGEMFRSDQRNERSEVFESELSKEKALFFKMIAADDSKDEILVSHINALFQD